MDNIKLELGQRVKRSRKQKGYTTEDLAKELNVSVGHISNIENGKNDIFRLGLLFSLCKTLNISIEELLCLDNLQVKSTGLNTLTIEINISKHYDIPEEYLKEINVAINQFANELINMVAKRGYSKQALGFITHHFINELSFFSELNNLRDVDSLA